MTTEHRRAPRREVVEITRTGKWGKVTYQHRLSCGHIESRPRAASSNSLACAWCLRAQEKDKEILSLSAPEQTGVYFEHEEEQSITDFDFFVEKLRSGIASKFSIPLDAVDITVIDSNGKFVIKSAVVFLSSADVARLGGH